jgi:hypothetical protein
MSVNTAPLKTLSTLAATLALAALPSPPPVQASTGIQRCSMDDGSVAYADVACSTLGGQSVPIAGEVMTRLVATMPEDASEMPASTAIASRRSPAAGCARTLQQLEADLLGSLALGDANRIAESYHWAGLSHAAGQQVMDRLQSLGKRPVRDLHYFNAQIASLGVDDTASADAMVRAASPRSAGTLQLQLGGTSVSVIDLDVEQYAGCYFVRFLTARAGHGR